MTRSERGTAASLLDMLARVKSVSERLHAGQDVSRDMASYMVSTEKNILLNPRMLNRLLGFLVDFESALQLIYVDANYRSSRPFDASIDLSEIYAYTNPASWRQWASVVRFAIESQPDVGRHYHVLPTTLIEVLSQLRRFDASCRAYGDYDVLSSFLRSVEIQQTPDFTELSELSLGVLCDATDVMSLGTFLSTLRASQRATDGEPHPGDPAGALLHLLDLGTVRSIDTKIEQVLADDAALMEQFNPEYQSILSALEWRRPRTGINNSIDARSYQLSLALNEAARATEGDVYLPILSSGAPLDEFAKIGWGMDPLYVRANRMSDDSGHVGDPVEVDDLIKDELVDVKDLRLFTTARSRHYHYLSTVMFVKYGDDFASIASVARDCALEVKRCVYDWADTMKGLDVRHAGPSMSERMRSWMLRLPQGEISTDALVAIERSRSRGIRDTETYKERRSYRGDQWFRVTFGNKNDYQRILDQNHDRIRNQVVELFAKVPAAIDQYVGVVREDGEVGTPDFADVIRWAREFVASDGQ